MPARSAVVNISVSPLREIFVASGVAFCICLILLLVKRLQDSEKRSKCLNQRLIFQIVIFPAKRVKSMAKKGTIVLFAACCILVSIPVSYFVNAYRMENVIPPTDTLTSFAKYLPFLALSVILIYGAYKAARLANSNNTKEAQKLSVILIVTIAVALAVWLLTFNLGVRYVL